MRSIDERRSSGDEQSDAESVRKKERGSGARKESATMIHDQRDKGTVASMTDIAFSRAHTALRTLLGVSDDPSTWKCDDHLR